MHFSRQMAAFVRTGIPITEALEVVEDGSNNKRFRQIVATMREQINNGVPFSEAIAEHSKIFPPYYIGILKSAELTGQLDVSLDQLSSYIERDLDSKSKIKAAMIYPMVIFGMSMMTVVILSVWVMPKFVVFFKNLDAKLPLPTMLLIKGSELSQSLWYVWVTMFVAFIALMLWMHKSPKGRMLRDRLFLKVPLVKEVVLFAVTERVCRIVGGMVKAGVPLPETLNAAIQGTNNKVFEKGLLAARDRMLEGEGLAEPIVDTHLFPRAAGQMMRVGEDTGTLDIQLENAAEYYGRARVQAQEAHVAVRARRHHLHGSRRGLRRRRADLRDVRRLQHLEVVDAGCQVTGKYARRQEQFGPRGTSKRSSSGDSPWSSC